MSRARFCCLWITLLIEAWGAMPSARADPAPAQGTGCAVLPAVPSVPANAKLLAATTAADASATIQAALDNLKTGDWLVFSPGIYRIGKPLIVSTAGVTLYGQGATLFSTDSMRGGLTVRGDGVAVYGFTLDQASSVRQSAPWAGGIAIYDEQSGVVRKVRNTVIQKNVVNHAAAAGIFIYTAEGFTVADNTVWRSLADGIHMTAGASNGRVIGNTVSQTGDDMIAVVSYAGSAAVPTAAERYQHWSALQKGLSQDIYIGSNRVFDQYWGRGISVVGGSRITVENNRISRTPKAAGIYLERESSYRTFGVHDVLVRGNEVSEIETAPSKAPLGPPVTGHGAIEIGSLQDADESGNAKWRAAFSVANVTIIDNIIEHTPFAGIRIGVGARNTVSRVLIRANELVDVGTPGIAEVHPGSDPTTTRCIDNKLDGIEWSTGCARASGPRPAVQKIKPANGARLRCVAARRAS